jgi:TRAP-type C4-dicarboxylate transport system permease small subunit
VPPSDDPPAAPPAPSDPEPAPAAAAADPHADDGPVAGRLRRIDDRIGLVEQVVVVALLAVVVVTSISGELVGLIRGKGWGDDGTTIIKYSVFGIAMIAGAYATHQRRLLSLDLVSRFLKPRARAILRIALAVFAVFIAVVTIWGGWKIYESVREEAHGLIPIRFPALFIPLGFVLVGTHLLIQIAIEIDYLRRGKTAPEPEQGAA